MDFYNNMPAAGGKFLGILETKNTFLRHFWTRFSRKNAPEILKISRLRRAYTSISPPIGGEISEISPLTPQKGGGNIIDFGVSPPIGGKKITPAQGFRHCFREELCKKTL